MRSFDNLRTAWETFEYVRGSKIERWTCLSFSEAVPTEGLSYLTRHHIPPPAANAAAPRADRLSAAVQKAAVRVPAVSIEGSFILA